MSKTLFYAVHITNRATRQRGTGWVWSRAFDSAKEAKDEILRKVDAGDITIGFVVRMSDGQKEILINHTWPNIARRNIQRFLELEDKLEEQP